MDTEDDQKSVGSNIAEGGVEEDVENAVEEPEKVVRQKTSTSDASQPGAQPGEVGERETLQDEEAGAQEEEQEEKSAEDLRELEEELEKITVSVTTLYVLLVFPFILQNQTVEVHTFLCAVDKVLNETYFMLILCWIQIYFDSSVAQNFDTTNFEQSLMYVL